MNKLSLVLALAVLTASLGTQAATTCCKYLLEWNGGDPASTPCSGRTTRVCENGVVNTQPPVGEERNNGLRWAECLTWDVNEGGYFIRDDCTAGPPFPSAVLVGILPNGQCCWAYNPAGISIPSITQQGFKLATCERPCESGDGGE